VPFVDLIRFSFSSLTDGYHYNLERMEGQKRFMIIDDDRDDRDLFCETILKLDPPGLCLTAINGEDGLMKLRRMEQYPDFIFLDLNMPRMNGKQCLAELKKDARLKNIPVVIYTTSSTQSDIDETSKLGASDFLTKPSDFKVLGAQILSITKKITSTLFL
jgi:CheY-like chemotaxis protein